jgi:hypothetical protein
VRLPTPEGPSERGVHAGLPYWLWAPPLRPGEDSVEGPAMIILHGAG